MIFENQVDLNDVELRKLVRYYQVHECYLSRMGWGELLGSKVEWGLEDEGWEDLRRGDYLI